MINFQFCQNCHRRYQNADALICCDRATSLHFACEDEEEYQSLLPSAEMAETVFFSWPVGAPMSHRDADRNTHAPLWYVFDIAIGYPVDVRHADGREYTILPIDCPYGPGEAWLIPAHHPAAQ